MDILFRAYVCLQQAFWKRMQFFNHQTKLHGIEDGLSKLRHSCAEMGRGTLKKLVFLTPNYI